MAAAANLTGIGMIDGQGYDWWWFTIIFELERRPHLIVMEEVSGIYIDLAYVQNSPQFHFLLNDVENVVVRKTHIYVDVEAQKTLLKKKGMIDPKTDIPVFPLNTDGIDVRGKNTLIENVFIENYDDAVAAKPCNQRDKYCTCCEKMLVRNSEVRMGVGMTIGSVPPHRYVNCVRDIVFDNITFFSPFKAIYVKSNPGNDGSGIINNITYQNIRVDASLWYPIFIGPQQQEQPGTNGTGCSFFYPLVPECPTQPRVAMSNIKLYNVTFINGVTLPGVLLCDPATPCTGFEFNNVINEGEFLVQPDYVCKNVEGSFINSKPPIVCSQDTFTKY